MTSLRIASWNICHGSAPGRVEVGHQGLLDAVASLDADVLALLEIEANAPRSGFVDQIESVAQRTATNSTFGRATRVGGTGDYGIALFTRAPHGGVVHHLERIGDNEPRCAIEADVTADSVGALTVFATHLSRFRDESTRQLEFLLHRIASTSGPVVLMGDFNRRPHEVLPRLEQAGLTVADTGPTFLGSDPAVPPSIRIDYIAVRGLVLNDVEVRTLPLSDHAALVASVSLPA